MNFPGIEYTLLYWYSDKSPRSLPEFHGFLDYLESRNSVDVCKYDKLSIAIFLRDFLIQFNNDWRNNITHS